MLRFVISCAAAFTLIILIVSSGGSSGYAAGLDRDKAEQIVRKIDQKLFFLGEAGFSYKDIRVDSEKDIIFFRQELTPKDGGESQFVNWRLQGYSENPETGSFSARRLNVDLDLPPSPVSSRAKALSVDLEASGLKGDYNDRKLSLAKLFVNFKSDGSGAEKTDLDLSVEKLSVSNIRRLVEIFLASAFTKAPPEGKALTEVLGLVSLGELELTGFPLMTGKEGGKINLKAVRFEDYRDGLIEAVSLEGLKIDRKDEKVKALIEVGEVTVNEISIPQLVKLREVTRGTTKPSPELFNILFKSFKGYSVKDVKFRDKRSGVEFEGEGEVRWGDVVGVLPVNFNSTGSSKMRFPEPDDSQNPPPPGAEALFEALAVDGVLELLVRGDVNFRWDEKSSEFTLSSVHYSVEKMASVKLSVTIGGVTRAILEAQDPKLALALLSGATIEDIQFEVQDKGAQETFEDLIRTLWDDGKSRLPEHPKLTPVFDAVDKIVSKPGQKAKVKITPISQVHVAQVVAAGAVQPLSVLELFDLDVTVSE